VSGLTVVFSGHWLAIFANERHENAAEHALDLACGPMVSAFVLIAAEPHRIADLATELADVDGIAEVYSTAGEADIVAVVRVRRHDQLAEVVTRRISMLEGIVDTRTLIAFQAYSRHDLDALFNLGEE
jgi:DNA-binding Lrp family transcriptional regulator